MSHFLMQCITMDGIVLSHNEQVKELCNAGAKWIQLRMKMAKPEEVEAVAVEVLPICSDHDTLLVINDHLDVAIKTEAGGVHLGKEDTDWKTARSLAGPDMVIGGTVNTLRDARAALACECLDYVGVGPYHFTETKKNLSPVLDKNSFSEIMEFLGELPKVVIGGVIPEDLPSIATLDADGVAISSGLFANGSVNENFNAYLQSWPGGS
ncbi:MAG: thiamine phosphate synthase [Opitutaceae bacterium]|nr:thiamine phosphate synthase [Opitutaceae bacterium]